jgi:hypothetical protein
MARFLNKFTGSGRFSYVVKHDIGTFTITAVTVRVTLVFLIMNDLA